MSQNVLQFDSVQKKYHYEQYPLLEGLSFELKAREKLTILAQSQSGKTTIAKLILGMEKATGGQIKLNGNDVCEYKGRDKGVFYVPKSPLLFENRSIEYNLCYTQRVRKVKEKQAKTVARQMCEQYGLCAEQKVKSLNYTQKLGLYLIRGAMREYNLVIFDDPTAEILAMYERYNNQKDVATLILTSDFSLLQGKVVVIHNGVNAFCGESVQAVQFAQRMFI